MGAGGLITIVAGTFLPWLTSGGVQRDSYTIVGILDRFALLGTGFGALSLRLWPLLGPVAMVALAVGVLRWWRTAATLTLLYGLLTGIVGGGVLAVAGGSGGAGVALAPAGPIVTLAGGILAVAGASILLIGGRARRIREAVDSSGESAMGPSRRDLTEPASLGQLELLKPPGAPEAPQHPQMTHPRCTQPMPHKLETART